MASISQDNRTKKNPKYHQNTPQNSKKTV